MQNGTDIPEPISGVLARRPVEEEHSGEPASVLRVMVHSFVVIPFLIAVAGTSLFGAVRLLTADGNDVFELLDDIENGYTGKRWRAAFELSRVLARAEDIPAGPRFAAAMTRTFDHARNESNEQVRQYLALAMGRSGKTEFTAPLVRALETDPEVNRPYILHALGLLKDPAAAEAIAPYTADSDARVRLQAVIALGNIGGDTSRPYLADALNDLESNVRWDAAIALAKMGDDSGKDILVQLLDRGYLAGFAAVDGEEQVQILLVTIRAGALLQDPGVEAATKSLAESDPNMEVRRAALEAIRISKVRAAAKG